MLEEHYEVSSMDAQGWKELLNLIQSKRATGFQVPIHIHELFQISFGRAW